MTEGQARGITVMVYVIVILTVIQTVWLLIIVSLVAHQHLPSPVRVVVVPSTRATP